MSHKKGNLLLYLIFHKVFSFIISIHCDLYHLFFVLNGDNLFKLLYISFLGPNFIEKFILSFAINIEFYYVKHMILFYFELYTNFLLLPILIFICKFYLSMLWS